MQNMQKYMQIMMQNQVTNKWKELILGMVDK